ncbi:MAG: hypothetical protein ACREKR_00395 [Candidatus Methylomirabilales bacterium]
MSLYKKPADLPPLSHKPIGKETVIADLIETYGDQAERILRRYGLYCLGCHHSTYDSIALGARQHGINEEQVNYLVRELNQIFPRT